MPGWIITTQSLGYRPEIDGLRAMAVIAVIANHFNKNILPSGYLGVDIFFVISGFVITNSLRRHPAKDLKDFLLGFYARRVKRILPALLVMVLISSVGICLFDPNPGTSLLTGIASVFGFSNIYLVIRLTDYFAASADLNVFLHTWSLGIEEQFYFLFPLLVWLTGFGRNSISGSKRLLGLLIPMFLLSILAFVVIYPRSQPHAYFLLTSRFWELASGCLISLLTARMTARAPWLPSALLVFVGLIATLFLPLTQAVTATIICIALTCLLIVSLRPGDPAYRLLSAQGMVTIGLISYSLYLWHWPILALSRWTIGIHPETIPFQLLFIVVVATLSYKFVESPLRTAHWPTTQQATIGIALLASLASSLLIGLLAKIWKEALFLGQRNDLELRYSTLEGQSAPVCNVFDDPSVASYFPERCGTKRLVNQRTIYVLGDSQIEQFTPAISAFANKNSYSFRGVWGNACAFPALEGVQGVHQKLSLSATCQQAQRTAEKTIKSQIKLGDIVFIGSYLGNYFNTQDTRAISGSIAAAREAYLRRLIALAETLIGKGAKVVIYLNGPRFNGLEGAVEGYCFPQWYKTKLDPSCRVSASPYRSERLKDFHLLYEWSDGINRVLWDGVDPRTCDSNYCYATHYKDEAHFRTYYANYLFANLMQQHPGLISKRQS
jgi:peptidoglycan/LPS O-acetylase OafA/YrhL